MKSLNYILLALAMLTLISSCHEDEYHMYLNTVLKEINESSEPYRIGDVNAFFKDNGHDGYLIRRRLEYLIAFDIGNIKSTLLQDFDTSSAYSVIYSISDEYACPHTENTVLLGNDTLGLMVHSPEDPYVYHIILNPSLCDKGNDISTLVVTLLHETLHLTLTHIQKVILKNADDGIGLPELYEQYFDENVTSKKYLRHQHHLMVEYFRDNFSEALSEYYNVENVGQFEYISWKGLKEYSGYVRTRWFFEKLEKQRQLYYEHRDSLVDPCKY